MWVVGGIRARPANATQGRLLGPAVPAGSPDDRFLTTDCRSHGGGSAPGAGPEGVRRRGVPPRLVVAVAASLSISTALCISVDAASVVITVIAHVIVAAAVYPRWGLRDGIGKRPALARAIVEVVSITSPSNFSLQVSRRGI